LTVIGRGGGDFWVGKVGEGKEVNENPNYCLIYESAEF
jgi:hypothetical protein